MSIVRVVEGKVKSIRSIKISDLGVWVTYDNDTVNSAMGNARFIPKEEYKELDGIIKEFIDRIIVR